MDEDDGALVVLDHQTALARERLSRLAEERLVVQVEQEVEALCALQAKERGELLVFRYDGGAYRVGKGARQLSGNTFSA